MALCPCRGSAGPLGCLLGSSCAAACGHFALSPLKTTSNRPASIHEPFSQFCTRPPSD
ncbi:hypothetical protein BDV97DRAFT_350734 [Delphinella strobiligena]|nr:hypothetical protein BDV97DRAFT_350734 [Delphinella strobiligena]